jgi:hypothetical protein
MRKIILAIGLCAVFSTKAEAVPIGYVKTVSGETSVTTDGKPVKATAGTPVHLGSVLKTSANASMGVTFKDETVMSFGPNTELTVEEYLYSPSKGKLRLGSKLIKGSMNYLSGVIAKLKPDAISVTTPVGTIGVRGTQFLVLVEE